MARLFRIDLFRSCRLGVLIVLGTAAALSGIRLSWGNEPAASQADPQAECILWHSDYGSALAAAKQRRTLALLWFVDPRQSEENEKWEGAVLADAQVRERLAQVVAVKLPRDVTVASGENGKEEVVLLDHPAFAELHHQPGIVLIDMSDEASPHFHYVVSVYPFERKPLSRDGLIAMLDLPQGSLTQRTLIWAVRIHRENPQSAGGLPSSVLASEAESHSLHQASINLQGHHNWESRFLSINARLGGRMVSREVCAESWPQQHLVEAAEECVYSWRQSSGHWEAVNTRHECYGYDMKLGTNGIWYATGIFGDSR